MSSEEGQNHFAYISDLDAFDLYHLVQEKSVGGSASDGGPFLPALGHAMAGAIATAIAKATAYPIDTVTTRLQVQKQFRGKKEAPSAASNADAEYKSLPDAVRKIYKNEGGVGAFYSGCLTEVAKGIIDSFCFFLAYTAIRDRMVQAAGTKRLPVGRELSVGIMAGCFSKGLTSPIQNVVTRQQTAALIAARNPSDSGSSAQLSVKDIIHQIYEEKGLSGFWSGYSAAVILTLNPAITFAAEKALKRLVPKSRRDNPSAYQTFMLAALSKVIATTITYPITMAKSRAMTSGSAEDREKSHVEGAADGKRKAGPRLVRQGAEKIVQLARGYASLFLSLQNIARTEGFQGLYTGLEGDVLKGFLQHGLTMMIKEHVHGNVVRMYFALLKLRQQSSEETAQGQLTGAAAAIGESVKSATKKVVG